MDALMNQQVHVEAMTATQRACLAYTLGKLQQQKEEEEDSNE